MVDTPEPTPSAPDDHPVPDDGRPALNAGTRAKAIGTCLGTLGGTIGGAIGYFGFFWLMRQGFYGIVLPGAMIGIGCGSLSGRRSAYLGLLCATAGLALGVFTEWRYSPFRDDASFPFFVHHILDLRRITLFLLALGAFLGFWFGMGREGGAWFRRSARSDRADD